MAKHRTDVGIYGQPVPEDWFQSLMEYIGTLASNFVISLQTSTSIRVVAGAGSLQAALGIEGKWRYNSATVTQAHPGGAAGQYDIYAIASANSFAAGGPSGETDNTDYSFGLYIITHGTPLPGGLTWNGKPVAHSRLVGSLTWDGAAITDIRQSVGGGGVPLHAATHVAGAADTLPWTTIHGLGTLAARPAASASNQGYIYFATDANGGTLYESNGSAWTTLLVRAYSQGADLTITGSSITPTQPFHRISGGGTIQTITVPSGWGGGQLLVLKGAFTLNSVGNIWATPQGGSLVVNGNGAAILVYDATNSVWIVAGVVRDTVQVATEILLSGTLASRPAAAAANSGFYYFATDDNGGTEYQSNGSAWQQRGIALADSRLSNARTPTAHETTHLAAGSDALPWTTINGYGTLAARPAAAAANAGYTYYATDNATQYRSDGATWSSISSTGYGAGIILDFAGPEANIPANTVVADGRELSQATYSAAYARIGNQWNTFAGLPAPSAGNFRVPDLRGRGTVGKNNMGAGPAITGAYIARAAGGTLASLIGEEYHTLVTGEMPSHQHGGSTGSEAAHTHSGTTGAGSAHSHGVGTLAFTGSAVTSGAGSAHSHGVGTLAFTGSAVTSGAGSSHSHGVTGAPGFSDPTHSHTWSVRTYSQAQTYGETSIMSDANAANTSGAHQYGSSISSSGTGITTGVGTLGTAAEAAHTHSVTAAGTLSGSDAAEAAHTHSVTAAGTIGGSTATESAHTHSFTTGAGSSHLHSIPLEGGGGSHENVWPVAVVIKVMTLA